ncbi:MAG TPA: alpha-amylase [Desulfobacteraceae bacterium]|nr:alpha-amylase [Desulfobacteraceae bacterium]
MPLKKTTPNFPLDDFSSLRERVNAHLKRIYPDRDANTLADKTMAVFSLDPDTPGKAPADIPRWSQADMVMITYGNTMVEPDQKPLKTLHRFLTTYLEDLFSIVHILPFFPYSSDDGFAVMDYFAVNPALGGWKDIERIAGRYNLMADLVVNHTSSRARWFENFKNGRHPGKDFYVAVDPASDLSQVIRPRTSPLLREVATPDGTRHVWCTFSHDQVDLDFKNPEVLLAFLSIIRLYLDKGVGIFRLDAVAFLWKEICTTCLHLEQTHEIIKLFRTLIEAYAPRALIITETNVPSHENISYLGKGDEAHVIYNFPLPPLLLNTMVTGSSHKLMAWLKELPEPICGTTCLNFIASHDGIGLRPVEGWLSDREMADLLGCMTAFGGKISTRALNDQEVNPYEINISLWDAVKGTITCGPDGFQADRFICAHAVMLALRGIPAFYIHSLLATENDYERRDNLVANRAVNRHIWDYGLLCQKLGDTASHHHHIFSRLCALAAVRKAQATFHPDAEQVILDLGDGLVAFLRRSQKNRTILCLHNITDQPIEVPADLLPGGGKKEQTDLVTGTTVATDGGVELAPYRFMWLAG